MAKRCNVKRNGRSYQMGRKGARINSISPGIIVTPLALDELTAPEESFIKICLQNARQAAPERRMKLPLERSRILC